MTGPAGAEERASGVGTTSGGVTAVVGARVVTGLAVSGAGVAGAGVRVSPGKSTTAGRRVVAGGMSGWAGRGAPDPRPGMAPPASAAQPPPLTTHLKDGHSSRITRFISTVLVRTGPH
jgi:hypothetical protein